MIFYKTVFGDCIFECPNCQSDNRHDTSGEVVKNAVIYKNGRGAGRIIGCNLCISIENADDYARLMVEKEVEEAEKARKERR